MTRLAVIGADHYMNIITVVIKRVRMRFRPPGVAFGAPYRNVLQVFRNRSTRYLPGNAFGCHGFFGGDLRVATVLPISDNAGVK
jgi:hypothetical protein